jgi:cysteine desulfurase
MTMPLDGYFDYNATTPVCDEAVQAQRLAEMEFANPSAKYGLAKKAKEALALAREQVARMVNSGSDEIAFTSGGTEANNWAIKGALAAQGAFGRRAEPAHVIVSEIEHASVLEAASYLERIFDCEVTRLKPDAEGKVSASAVAAALKSNTRLVSVMLVNNEVGTLQPVRQIAALVRERGIHFHVDGVQAVGKIHVDVRELGMDTMSFAAHKFYGPKGVGGLFVRRGVRLEPLLHGGGQEGGTRGGTEAVASIVAMGAAAEATQRMLPEMLLRLSRFRTILRGLLVERVPGVSFNGPENQDAQAPNTLSVRIAGVRAEALAALLDQMHGIQVSLGSACSNNKRAALSHVLLAMGLSEAAIRSTLRVSIGRYTREEDLHRFAEATAQCLRALQKISSGVNQERAAVA